MPPKQESDGGARVTMAMVLEWIIEEDATREMMLARYGVDN